MANIPTPTIGLIEDGIRKELYRKVEETFEQIKKDFMEKLDKDKAQIISGIALHVNKMLEFQTSSDRIIITLVTKTQ